VLCFPACRPSGAHGGPLDTAARPAAGPSSEVGLHLRSFRVAGGLEATLQLDKKYQAFPGAACAWDRVRARVRPLLPRRVGCCAAASALLAALQRWRAEPRRARAHGSTYQIWSAWLQY